MSVCRIDFLFLWEQIFNYYIYYNLLLLFIVCYFFVALESQILHIKCAFASWIDFFLLKRVILLIIINVKRKKKRVPCEESKLHIGQRKIMTVNRAYALLGFELLEISVKGQRFNWKAILYRMVRFCVPGCSNRSDKESHLSYFGLPLKDKKLLKQWVHVIRHEHLRWPHQCQ